MDNISSDEIIKNIKKVSDKYQEIILCLMQGRGNMIPESLIDMDKNKVILSSLSEQFIKNPEKFWQLNIQYVEKFQNLVINSVEKFVGKSTTPLFSPNSKDRRFKDLA
ncbi:hypothetical protein [Candidatus Tisiphia endosymbiont of Psammoecus bipunctatus]|uniref:hypothetical protein n=1 Tax=Candidatus Tisiphia endosymbiont of Psammoecus bipunctatus TaxID=3139333 RepID=UPI0035C90B9E